LKRFISFDDRDCYIGSCGDTRKGECISQRRRSSTGITAESDLNVVQVILRKEEQDVEDNDGDADQVQTDDNVAASGIANSGDGPNSAHRLREINAAYNGFLYTKADQWDPIVNCCGASEACVASIQAEKEDSHRDIQDRAICDEHP
jgi:hypothetical protein